MTTKELIIRDIAKDKLIDEKLLRDEYYYGWYWNKSKNIVVITGEGSNYETEDSDETFIELIYETYTDDECNDEDEVYRFGTNHIRFYHTHIDNDDYARLHEDVIFSDTKWNYVDSSTGYDISYKRINNVYVWIVD